MAVTARRTPAAAKGKTSTPPSPAPAAAPARTPASKLPAPPAAAPPPSGPAVTLSDPKTSKDPRFLKVMEKLEKSASKTKEHPSPSRKAAEAAAAARAPANEKLAGAQAGQVKAMTAAEPGKTEPDSFINLLMGEIRKLMPKKLGDTESFMKGEKKKQLKGALTANVDAQQQQAAGGMKAAAAQTPDPTRVQGKEVVPIPPEKEPAPPAPVGAAGAMPAPRPETEVSLQKGKEEADRELARAEVTPQQLKRANEPKFTAALNARNAVIRHADTAPGIYRADEAKTLSSAAGKAAAEERSGLAAFAKAKGGAFLRVQSRQLAAKEKDEAERKRVTATITAIYSRVKSSVEKKLEKLEKEVSARFDPGLEAALKKMTDFVEDRMFQWKVLRYGSSFGLLWVADQVMGLPAEVDVFYEGGRKLFVQELNRTLTEIAALVERRLKEAKEEIARGEKEISDYVQGLDPGLKAIGKAAEREMSSRFQELRQSVDNKKGDLAQSLAQRYKEAHEKADAKLKEIKEANKTLGESLKETILEVGQILREFKERLLKILRKAKSAVALIMLDPIRFLMHLLQAVKQGFGLFVDNILEHLKKGFMEWMFGSLCKLGVELPNDFSLPSILKLVLGVLGITYQKIRAVAVKVLGAKAVGIVEKVAGYIVALIKGGIGALWDMVKEDLGNLKELVIESTKSWLITTLIKRGTAQIVMMFNPIGAIIKAMITIYDVVMFLWEHRDRILDFLETVVDSLYDMAVGAVGKAAKALEKSLAKIIPLLIGLLARIVGLTGISEQIRKFIQKAQDKVERAMEKVVKKVVPLVKKALGAAKAGVEKVIAWWKRKAVFSVKGKQHSLFFAGTENSATLRVKSEEQDLAAWLEGKTQPEVKTIKTHLKRIDALRKKIVAKKGGDPSDQNQKIVAHFDAIVELLPAVFAKDAQWGTKDNPVLMKKYPKKAASFYEPVYLGPRIKGKAKLPQSTLRIYYNFQVNSEAKDKAEHDKVKTEEVSPMPNAIVDWLKRGGTIKLYHPFKREPWPDDASHGDDTRLGVSAKYLVQPGTCFQYLAGATPGGKKLNNELHIFGFYGRKNGGPDVDADHVLEAQVIGKTQCNVIENMWPLDKKENQHGKHLADAEIEIPGKPKAAEKTLEDAHKSKDRNQDQTLWVMIKGTKDI